LSLFATGIGSSSSSFIIIHYDIAIFICEGYAPACFEAAASLCLASTTVIMLLGLLMHAHRLCVRSCSATIQNCIPSQ